MAFWATADGSYGSSDIYIADTTEWTEQQWEWFTMLADSGDVYNDDLENIDKGIMPEALEE